MVKFAQWRRAAILSCAIVWSATSAHGQTVRFVDAGAEGLGNGTSWIDAYTDLRIALEHAGAGDQVWVAAGVYRPGTSRGDTFHLVDGVSVFGGFSGLEDPASFNPAARDFVTNETVLDGDAGDVGGVGGAFHVVTGSGVGATAVLDGFTITGSRADGAAAFLQDRGGGIVIVAGDPIVRNCMFAANLASSGGAVYVHGGRPTFLNCRFLQNTAIGCQPTNPEAARGGAVLSYGDNTQASRPTFINCLFTGNNAGVGCGGRGGAICSVDLSFVTVLNSTFTQNTADHHGGGLAVFGGAAKLANCILWQNRDSGGADQSAQLFGPASITYSCVRGGWSGVGNVNDDPLFVDPIGADGVAGTEDDDLGLSSESPAIDAGRNASVPIDVTDLDGDGDTTESLPLDLGRDARFANDPHTLDSGSGIPPIVDMGPYEYQAACDADADCDDGLTCDGVETCAAGRCRPGAAPNCDDDDPTTVDACDEQLDQCTHQVTCTLFDMNGDGFPSIIGDVEPFVNVVYFGDLDWYGQVFPGMDPVCPGDCNCDGFLSIIGDAPCFVDCVYFGRCATCAGAATSGELGK